jgi:hypothetical protein
LIAIFGDQEEALFQTRPVIFAVGPLRLACAGLRAKFHAIAASRAAA